MLVFGFNGFVVGFLECKDFSIGCCSYFLYGSVVEAGIYPLFCFMSRCMCFQIIDYVRSVFVGA
jgi:hypothetical protein